MLLAETQDQIEDVERAAREMDESVAEVFERMLGLHCGHAEDMSLSGFAVAAEVMFSGSIQGRCVVAAPPYAAERITDAMLGSEGDWDDEMIGDAIGELCNIVAGAWKFRMGAAASSCSLSVPKVRGIAEPRTEEAPESSLRSIHRSYRAGDLSLQIELGFTRLT